MKMFSPHLEFDRLADMAEGRLSDSERQQTLAHLSGCSECSEKFNELERTIEMMRSDTSEDVPAYAFENAKNMFRARVKPAVKQLLATLKFDSLLQTPEFAVRSAATSERQLLFNAGERDLHLQIKQRGNQCVVLGQVLGPCAGGRVELQGINITVNAVLSDLCEFTLEPVPEGVYVLSLRFSDAELKIPELKLSSW